jgi:ribonuclease J
MMMNIVRNNQRRRFHGPRRSSEQKPNQPELQTAGLFQNFFQTKKNGFFRPTKPEPGVNNDALRIIPLGGCEEVGRNMTVFEYGGDILILDMGLQFPEEDMPGIDYIIPNVKYLQGKEKNIRGVI